MGREFQNGVNEIIFINVKAKNSIRGELEFKRLKGG